MFENITNAQWNSLESIARSSTSSQYKCPMEFPGLWRQSLVVQFPLRALSLSPSSLVFLFHPTKEYSPSSSFLLEIYYYVFGVIQHRSHAIDCFYCFIGSVSDMQEIYYYEYVEMNEQVVIITNDETFQTDVVVVVVRIQNSENNERNTSGDLIADALHLVVAYVSSVASPS